ncbi:mucin TcMUCII [Trypanosoma cruzi cruzi]|nr:mucin TcMUCII [Trypanosoma cruzi cruzi]
MMSCRLLCALLVLALCCCPSECATAANEDTAGNSGEHSGPTKPKSEVANQVMQLHSTTPLPPKVSGGRKVTAESQGDLNQEQDQKKGDGKSTEEETDRDETDKAKEQNQKTNAINTITTTTTTTELPGDKKEPDAQANAGTTNLLTPAPVGKSPVADHSGSLGSGSGDVPGIVEEDGKSLTGMLAQSDDTNDNLQREGNNGTTGSQSSKKPSTEEEIKKGEDNSETTANAKTAPTTKTTTTQAPTTTTTTTAAPVAPSTTTTEATTTTTTRAPSRLRESDSSLSGSAWVCAPLLLAASALAYTALC